MRLYYYGVQTALSYILNHYFYNAVHYVYLAGEYYPYRRKNPRSSNPHRAYEDLYEPWKDKDEFSKVIIQTRINIKNGVLAQEARKTIDTSLADRLKSVCDGIDTSCFYPLIYRVDIKTIKRSRLKKFGSGTLGSSEYLVFDLQEREINDILFLDYERDSIIKDLVKYEYEHFQRKGTCSHSRSDVLQLLEDRVK